MTDPWKRMEAAIDAADPMCTATAFLCKEDMVNEFREAFAALKDHENIKRSRIEGFLDGLLVRVKLAQEELEDLIDAVNEKEAEQATKPNGSHRRKHRLIHDEGDDAEG